MWEWVAAVVSLGKIDEDWWGEAGWTPAQPSILASDPPLPHVDIHSRFNLKQYTQYRKYSGKS